MLGCRQLILPLYTKKNKDLEATAAALHAPQWLQVTPELIHIGVPLGVNGTWQGWFAA